MSLVAALPISGREFGPFLDELYGAAFEPRRLGQALRLFLDGFAADDGRIFVWDRFSGAGDRVRLISLDYETGASSFSATLSLAAKERQELLDDLASREACDEVVSGRIDNGQGQQRGKGWHYLAPMAAVGERWIIGLVALRQQRPFMGEEEREAADLIGDLKRAFAFHLKAVGGRSFALSDHLFQASAVALFVTRQKIVEHANEAGAALLERQGPVRVSGRMLRFEDSRVRAAFDDLAKLEPKSRAMPNAKTLAFIVSEANGYSWLAQLSRHPAPVSSPLLADAATSPIVMAALTPFSGVTGSREALIDGFVDLTTTERSVLSALVDGKDTGRIASDMARSVETVRWHVRNLFAKLGVNSQSDLARLGSLLLPI